MMASLDGIGQRELSRDVRPARHGDHRAGIAALRKELRELSWGFVDCSSALARIPGSGGCEGYKASGYGLRAMSIPGFKTLWLGGLQWRLVRA